MMAWSALTALLLGVPYQSDLPESAQRALRIAHFQLSLIESVEDVARYILHSISEVTQVLIATGFPTRWGFETDGPLGALNLASVLSLFNIPVKICLPSQLYATFQEFAPPFPVIGYGTFDYCNLDAVKTVSDSLLITVEYPGCNSKGVCHTMDGQKISPELTRLNEIIVNNSPKAWVAIGDGGNEIGLGRFHSAVESILPYGRTCQCGCRGGIAAHVSADHSLLSVTSNYGALGLALEILRQTGQKAVYSWAKEEKSIDFLNVAEIMDGVTGQSGTVDNIHVDLARHMLNVLLKRYPDLD